MSASRRLGILHLINIHRGSAIEEPFEVDPRELFLDGVHDEERRFGAIIEDAAQGRRGDSELLGEVLLGEVLVLHYLSNSIFHFTLSITIFTMFYFRTGAFLPHFSKILQR